MILTLSILFGLIIHKVEMHHSGFHYIFFFPFLFENKQLLVSARASYKPPPSNISPNLDVLCVALFGHIPWFPSQ